MKLVINKNVAEVYDGEKLVVRIEAPEGVLLDAQVLEPDAINVVKVAGVAVEVEGVCVENIDVEQNCT